MKGATAMKMKGSYNGIWDKESLPEKNVLVVNQNYFWKEERKIRERTREDVTEVDNI